MATIELGAPSGPVLLARELEGLGVRMVVVGSTATLLRTGRGRPRDLDVVVAPEAAATLLTAQRELGVPDVPRQLGAASPQTVLTGWCPLDVFHLDRPASASASSEPRG